MAINVKTITCPSCGGKVNYEENKKTIKCDFCGMILDISEEYGEKKDRERDDIQDMQIRNIMNNMRGKSTPNTDINIQKAKKTARVIIIIFVIFFFGSIILGVMGNLLRYSNIVKDSSKNSEVETKINPFDRLNISYYGMSGAATARIHDTNVNAISSIVKTSTNLENLSNGDTITVKYGTDMVKSGNTKYIFTATEKTFTVKGLEEYVADINDVGEEDLAILKKNAIEKAIYECDDEKFGYVEGSFDVCAIYSMVKKDYSQQKSIFIVSFDYEDPDDHKIKTGYFMAEYSNIKKLSSGEYKINFNADVFYYNRESYLGGFTVISAHSTWDAVYTDVYLNNKSEWSIHEDYNNR